MYQKTIQSSTLTWETLELPGVSMKVLDTDEDTGAMTVLTRIEAGASIPAHSHTQADESVFVLEGDFVEDGTEYGEGAYFFGARGTVHGPHESRKGCTVLTRFGAPLDFVMVEE